MNISDLVGALSTPHFPGAACVGQHAIFDAAESDPAAALAVCASCSALARCREWAADQKWPAGVVVGGQITRAKSRPRPVPVVLTLEERAEQLYRHWQAHQKQAQDQRTATKRAAST
ncbi:WhiB family transcriptional regulator [Mycobacterium paraintracellulare]|nr:WhiB family transcriptional regulator [Mycobacterium paraintracellulare]